MLCTEEGIFCSIINTESTQSPANWEYPSTLPLPNTWAGYKQRVFSTKSYRWGWLFGQESLFLSSPTPTNKFSVKGEKSLIDLTSDQTVQLSFSQQLLAHFCLVCETGISWVSQSSSYRDCPFRIYTLVQSTALSNKENGDEVLVSVWKMLGADLQQIAFKSHDLGRIHCAQLRTRHPWSHQ